MTDPNINGHDLGRDATLSAWNSFETGLTTYLGTMTEGDHLCIELGACSGDADLGCLPYAQFAVFDGGRMMRAEATGNEFLAPAHRVDDVGCSRLDVLGWEGNEDGHDRNRANWFREWPIERVDVAANHVRVIFAIIFGVVHPQLLSYTATGPATAGVDVLGLCATEDVPVEDTARTVLSQVVFEPTDRDDMCRIVSRLLQEKFGTEPVVDGDGDFVLHHDGHPVWIVVHSGQAAIEIMSCVARGVRSMRAASVEVSILNRDHAWAKWTLREKSIWQSVFVPAFPFAPHHLCAMIDGFLETLDRTLADLQLRTR